MTKVSANYSASSDYTINTMKETEWEISVKFKPMDEFEGRVPETTKELPAPDRADLLMWVKGFCSINCPDNLYVSGVLEKDIKVDEAVVISDGVRQMESKIERIMMFSKLLEQGEKGDKAYL